VVEPDELRLVVVLLPTTARVDAVRLVPNELLDVVAVFLVVDAGAPDETLLPATTLFDVDTVSWRDPLYTPLLEPLLPPM
jgi:hypothetical protein